MNIFLSIVFLLLLIHYAYFLIKIIKGLGRLYTPNQNRVSDHFISIIIPFRNESKNILDNLVSIQELNYPEDKYEVIYIDDNSTDNSCELICTNKKNSNILVLKLQNEIAEKGNKKRAIQFGIEKCRGDIIVSTDADCTYHTNWLINLINCFDSGTAFVSGPVGFEEPHGIFAKFQKVEFEGLVLAGAGLIGSENPAICNGANMAYTKKAFREVNGLNDNISLSSGDDVLLMQKISRLTDYKVVFCSSREAVVLTQPEGRISDFFNQRKRWASKSLDYIAKGLTLKLILIFMFYLGIIIQLFLIGAGYSVFLITFILSMSLKAILEYIIIRKGESLFFSRNKRSIILLTELLQVPYILISVTAGILGNFTWKDRKIKR